MPPPAPPAAIPSPSPPPTGVGSPATQAFTLNVTTAASAAAITSARAYTAFFGLLFGVTVTTNGYPAPLFSETGKIPPGVYFAGNGDGTATISGVPDRTALGPYTLKLTAANRAGKATQSFLLIIEKAPVLAKVPATTATIGTPMDLAITATGYNTPVLTESGDAARLGCVHQHRKRPRGHHRHPGQRHCRHLRHHHHRSYQPARHSQPDLHPHSPPLLTGRARARAGGRRGLGQGGAQVRQLAGEGGAGAVAAALHVGQVDHDA